LNDNLTSPEKISIKGNIRGVQIISQKYVLVLQSFSLKKQELKENNGSWNRLVLVDVEAVLECSDSREEGVDCLKAPTSAKDRSDFPGEYEVFRIKNTIWSHWIASAKGLDEPEVFVNGHIRRVPEFHEKNMLENDFFGICYIGDGNGDVHSIKLYLDGENNFRKEESKLFEYQKIKNKQNKNMNVNGENKNEWISNDESNLASEEEETVDNLNVKECRQLIQENLDVIILREDFGNDRERFTLFVKEIEDKDYVSLEVGSLKFQNQIELNPIKNSKKSKCLKFYLINYERMILFSYNKKKKSIVQKKKLEFDDPMFHYNFEKDCFFISHNNSVKIYNSSLEHLTAVLKFDSEIITTELSKTKLRIYESEEYQEMDLDSLKPLYRSPIDNSINYWEGLGLFNVDDSFPNTQYHICNRSDTNVINPVFFTFKDFLQICDFPFEDIIQGFFSLDYKKHILNFSEYYFSKIKQTNYNDDLFRSLNPLTLCLYHNDTKLLEEVLTTYRYPRTIKGDITPLSYAFENNYISSVKLLCEHLSQCEYRVDLTKKDFEYLLDSPYSYCHRLMASIPQESELDIFPNFLEIRDNVKLFNVNNLSEYLLQIKQMESTFKNKNFSKKNKSNKKDVVTYEVPFKYSFEAGTFGSIKFLHNYSESHNQDFLLSQWKNLVVVKWRQQLPLQVMIAVVNWLFTLSVMTSMILARDTRQVKYLSIALTLALFVFEILQFVSYCSFKVSM
jgi:hypothetical protein